MSMSVRRSPGDVLLELGGGDRPFVNPRCLGGRDVNVDSRQARDPQGRVTVDFACDLNETLPVGDGEFDGVFSHFAIEHVSWRNLPKLLGEVFRVIKPGGYLTIVTANTEAQCEYIKNHPGGWEDRDLFTSASITIFGDQDYGGNFHSCYLSPSIVVALFTRAGFRNVVVSPYGAISTDMVIQADRPQEEKPPEPEREDSSVHSTLVMEGVRGVENLSTLAYRASHPELESSSTPPPADQNLPAPAPREESVKESGDPSLTSEGRKALYDRAYFNGGAKVGGYAPFYLDYPVHEVTARCVLARKPQSVLELGCARGYVLKRIQDSGVIGCGLEISRHAYLTRACQGITLWDVCETPWNVKDGTFDLIYSVGLLDHIPESLFDKVSQEMERVSQRGLHGVDFHPKDRGDQTRCNVRGKEWWQSHLPRGHEVVNKGELEDLTLFPREILESPLKGINIGSAFTQYHHGWENVDCEDLTQFAQGGGYIFRHHDVRNGLPHGTGTVDAIYCAHTLEHLTYDEGLRLLKEFRRVLKPRSGALRLILPDAELLMGKYLTQGEGGLSEFDELQDECRDAKTRAGKLHALLHQNHLSVYDGETLFQVLRECHFTPLESEFRGHPPSRGTYPLHFPNFEHIKKTTLDVLPCLSVYVNAVPEVG